MLLLKEILGGKLISFPTIEMGKNCMSTSELRLFLDFGGRTQGGMRQPWRNGGTKENSDMVVS